ncbi:hypothetical protein IKG10_00685 [Candidatus Saccharibacteria bacterium]|nr:hypothetical protein [Candidatus Saccharibacteria bacterium]
MMTKRRRRSRKWTSWLIVLVFLITAGVVCYLVWVNNKPNEREKQEQVTTEEKKEKDEKLSNNVVEENNNEVDNKKVIQYEGDDPNLSEELSGSVTYAGVLNDKITIRVNIDQYLSDGNCVLNLISNGDTVYNESVDIVNSASTATCEGFDVPVLNVGTGAYGVEIRILSGEKSGIIKGEVEI